MESFDSEVAWLLKEKYGGEKTDGFFADCARLEAGEPLAYLIGHVPFLDTKIYLDSRPLIPRAETEYWVEHAIHDIRINILSAMSSPKGNPWRGQGLPLGIRILDLCAGSGCVGIAVLKHIPETHVDLIEIDTDHHPTILKNVLKNNIEKSRARIVGGDTFKEADGPYDYILTNPPYIDPTLSGRIEKSVLEHEPRLALFGGKQGLYTINRIVDRAPAFLTPGGTMFLEHEPEQTEAITAYARQCGYKEVTTHKDQYNVDRMTMLKV